jgi:hypothetical protein
MRRLCLLLAPLTLAASLSATNKQIASGSPLWIDSQSDPEFAMINAKVDIGTLAQKGDALEAAVRWPASRRTGGYEVERQRVVCGPKDALSYSIEVAHYASDGTLIDRKANDPKIQRAKAEAYEAQTGGTMSYGDAPPDLICWAAARKCQGKPFSWPPPPNNTPLEYSARADAMRAAHNRQFVPACKLPPR